MKLGRRARPAGLRGARRRGHHRHGRVVVPSLLSGVLVALSLPPFGFWVLAIVGAALLWWRLEGLRVGQRVLAGWTFGLGMFVIGLWWVTEFNVYGGVALMVIEALAPAAAAAVAPAGRGRAAALAGAMMLAEWLRSSWPLGGLPLGSPALGQASGPLADVARIGGPRLVVGTLWLAGGAVGLLAWAAARALDHRARLRREPAGWRRLTGGDPPEGIRTMPPPQLAGTVLAGLGVAVAVTALVASGTLAPDGGAATGSVRVAAVQGGGTRGLSKSQVAPSTVFAAAVSATRSLIASSGASPPQLVVWPEDVVGLDHVFAGSTEEQVITGLAVAAHATLLAGVTEPAGSTQFRNFVVAVSPQGTLLGRYEKVHRVPFGEYIPWRSVVSHLADVSAVPQDAVSGAGDGVLHTPVGPLGTMISYEVLFPDRGRIPTRSGATLLVVPTNTSSYSTSQVPTQEIAAARLQAISEGRDLVQASPTGFSALIDNEGRVLRRSDLGGRALVTGTLHTRRGATFYERWGEPLDIVLGLLALVGGLLAALTAPPRRP